MTDAPARQKIEAQRLAALARYQILDTAREPEFDDIVQIAAEICGVPMALISLVDDRRQWFKAAVGLGVSETPREIAFCAHAIQQQDVFLVPDATRDPRFVNNPLVTGDPNLRFYAGAPLETPDGQMLGTLCVLDRSPRALTEQQQRALKALARQVMAQLELRQALAEQRLAEVTLRDLATSLQRQVQLGQRQHDRLWSSTNDLMATGNIDGTLREVNPAWQRLLGWDENTLLNKPWLDFVTTDDHSATVAALKRLAAGKSLSAFVNRLHARDTTLKVLSWDAVADADLFFIVGRDVTKQHAVEAALRQAQKMEAVGQLTGGIAHDFNNLLAGISGSIEVIRRKVAAGSTDGLERFFHAAASSTQRAAALTHRLLAFSRLQSLDSKPTDVNSLIENMEDLLRRTLGERIDLKTALDPGLWPAITDSNQFDIAVLNLVINARDAMPGGGLLTIETANIELDAAYAAANTDVSPGDYVLTSVSDTGTGMTPQVIAKAFDPFFTTKPVGQGTGLGLSMIYGFAKQSSGHVRIHSELGRGTTMKLYLPRATGETAVKTAIEETTFPAGRGETILVVEDDQTVRLLIIEVMNDLGYKNLEAPDAATAMKLLDSNARIDLLITDVGLPGGLNGRQLAEVFKAKLPDVKVLFITGYAQTAIVRGEFLAEGMEMLTKPFALDVLAKKARDMLNS